MRKKYAIATLTLGAVMLTTLAFAKGKTSVELGQKLFNDPALAGATSGKSCNSCHADGKGLEKATMEPKKLTAITNRCIISQMQGKKLDGRSAEMRSLKMYMESLVKKGGQAVPPPKASSPK